MSDMNTLESFLGFVSAVTERKPPSFNTNNNMSGKLTKAVVMMPSVICRECGNGGYYGLKD